MRKWPTSARPSRKPLGEEGGRSRREKQIPYSANPSGAQEARNCVRDDTGVRNKLLRGRAGYRVPTLGGGRDWHRHPKQSLRRSHRHRLRCRQARIPRCARNDRGRGETAAVPTVESSKSKAEEEEKKKRRGDARWPKQKARHEIRRALSNLV
jgi:hypothetical protein